MSLCEDEEQDFRIALGKNKVFVPLRDCSRLLEQIHWIYNKHFRLAKINSFVSARFLWKEILKDVKML